MILSVSIILSGLNLVERYPYETVQRDYDYVRLASITAGKFNHILPFSPYFIPVFTLKMFCSSHNDSSEVFLEARPRQKEVPDVPVTHVLPFIWTQSQHPKLWLCLQVVGWQTHLYPRLSWNNIIREHQWILMLWFFFILLHKMIKYPKFCIFSLH